jgi:peptidoglycan-N-acetylglucosamine deacetylase
MSVMNCGPLRLPFSGGGYLRLLPLPAVRLGFKLLHQRGLPVVVYLHPRDFAADCPRVSMPLHRRFKSYVGLGTTREKLRKLLVSYRFDSCAAVLGLQPSYVRARPRAAGKGPARRILAAG